MFRPWIKFASQWSQYCTCISPWIHFKWRAKPYHPSPPPHSPTTPKFITLCFISPQGTATLSSFAVLPLGVSVLNTILPIITHGEVLYGKGSLPYQGRCTGQTYRNNFMAVTKEGDTWQWQGRLWLDEKRWSRSKRWKRGRVDRPGAGKVHRYVDVRLWQQGRRGACAFVLIIDLNNDIYHFIQKQEQQPHCII